MIHRPYNLDTMPLRWGHFKVLIIASMGQVLGAGLSTLVGIILPLIQLTGNPHLTALQQGLVGCTALVGITAGSLLFGRLSDRYGYLFFFRLCPLIVAVAAATASFTTDITLLIVALFGMGIGIGGGYTLDADYISEIMPRRRQLFMVGVAKASSSLGNIGVALLCFLLLRQLHDPALWNHLLLIIAITALAMFLSRIRFVQSPGWLMAHGRPQEAEIAVHALLGDDVEIFDNSNPDTPRHRIGADREIGEIRNRPTKTPQTSLFRGDNLKKVIFCGVPWACEGLGVYGIGIFLPVLVMALGLETSEKTGGLEHIIQSVELTTWINLFVLPGFVIGLLLIRRCHPVRMQAWGFIGCAAGLTLLLASYILHLSIWVNLAGFMIFELFLNAGPHLLTFILPSQIYPVADRGEGAGVAAAMGKAGAVVGVLFIPLLLTWGGIVSALSVTIAVQLVGALITVVFGRKILP